MTTTTAYAVILRTAHGLVACPPGTTPACAVQALSPFEGAEVFGLATIAVEPEPISGLRYRLRQADAPAPAPVDGLLARVKAAEQRLIDGHALRRIPADPTDVDLVLAEVRAWLEGKPAPFWIKPAPTPLAEAGKDGGVAAFCEWLQSETLEVLRNVDTQFRTTGQPSDRIERLINALAGARPGALAGQPHGGA